MNILLGYLIVAANKTDETFKRSDVATSHWYPSPGLGSSLNDLSIIQTEKELQLDFETLQQMVFHIRDLHDANVLSGMSIFLNPDQAFQFSQKYLYAIKTHLVRLTVPSFFVDTCIALRERAKWDIFSFVPKRIEIVEPDVANVLLMVEFGCDFAKAYDLQVPLDLQNLQRLMDEWNLTEQHLSSYDEFVDHQDPPEAVPRYVYDLWCPLQVTLLGSEEEA